MQLSAFGRRIGSLVLMGVGSLAAAACGSSNSEFGKTTPDASSLTDGSGVVLNPGDGGGLVSSCVPKTCAQLGYTCGQNADGCNGIVNCGTCTSPAFCGGGGYSQCGTSAAWEQEAGAIDAGSPCVPQTCAQLGYNCGFAGDGCGNQLNCGGASACTAPAYCGGGGPEQCGGSVLIAADGGLASNCAPKTCADLGYNCGLAGDGCGNQIDCGGASACATPEYCGGGGANVCGGNVFVGSDGGAVTLCTPKTCAELGYTCGPAADGCGSLLNCGACTLPKYCGGGGPNVCGGTASVGADGGIISSCTPKTCAELGYSCGYAGDGCGNQLDCGGASACPSPEYCGGGGANVCGGSVYVAADGGTVNLCTPKTCAQLGYNCGPAADECGNLLQCGSCTSPQYCGGAGANVCGGSVYVAADGGTVSLCTPETCAQLGYNCGAAGDGCGNLLNCGSCTSPQYCGGGGTNVCGGSVYVAADGGTVNLCTPKTCAQLGYDCGPAGDGCGNLLNCGSCTLPQYCGGGAAANVCGGSVYVAADGGTVNLCTPKTCAQLGYNCGPAADGCGNLLNCGSCASPEYCGGGGGANVCGGSVYVAADGGTVNLCTPKTCAQLGYNCGPAADECGNLLQCGSCLGADTCGGAGAAGVCGHTCGGLCAYQASCPNGPPTTITGTVLAGVSAWTGLPQDPVPNVLVYVPNGPLTTLNQGFTVGSCPQCGADVSGDPLVTTYTNYDGTFTLTNVPNPPAGQTLPLVIQLGRWRREFQIAPPAPCAVTPIGNFNLPSNHTQGSIPETAISTGAVDALECVLLKMGVDQAEFTSNTANPSGRIHVYAGGPGNNGGNPGATVPNANAETTLMGATGTYLNYDQILFPCWGAAATKTPAELANLVTYANNGGHFFATHYSYSWLYGNPYGTGVYANGEFNNVATWNPNFNNPGTVTWTLNVSKVPPVVPAPMHSGIFWQWLNLVDALSNSNVANPPTNPEVAITNPRHDANAVANGSIDWIDGTDPQKNDPLVEHFTFNTPVGEATQCGHAIFSDFHVSGVTNANNTPFPTECSKTFSPQEKILEYMIFDLASCVTPPASSCVPLTCAGQGLSCGPAGDGCGNTIQCGTCTAPLTCGGAGVLGQCGEPDGGVCTPASCTQQGIACGPAGDGCGNAINCGSCPTGQTCGGGGVPGHCGAPDGGACSPISCASQGLACGPAGDGCGNVIECGTCPTGQTCGGAGTPGHCGAPDGGACSPRSCNAQNIECGPAGDGCGNALNCGTCPAGQTCGGGGVPGQCGAPDGGACVPRSCGVQNIGCGPAGDGCGNAIECGTCPTGETCGGGGISGQCGAPDGGACVPRSCGVQNIGCGPAGDGCGNAINCGTCPAGETCGGAGTSGQCGLIDGGTCVPESCGVQNIACGPAGDGCGNAISCGTCPAGQACGGGGVPGRCGAPDSGACVPMTCLAQSISCGPAGDGCGNAIACGVCQAPLSCGGGGISGVCGAPDAGSCVALTCAQQQIGCGPAGDGCGGALECGPCTAPQTCGGGGVNGQCGGGQCVPYTCAQLGYTCGPAGDGCGSLLQCGTCTAPETCGGGGQPSQCGMPNIPR
jgi:hypothetical protein